MNISIMEEVCWVCGKPKSNHRHMTRHHMLPQHLKPVKNIVVPVCEKCHKLINKSDVAGMFAHMIKLKKATEGLTRQMMALEESMDGHLKNRQKVKESET